MFKDFHIINNNGLKHNTDSINYMDDIIEITSYKNSENYSIYGDLYNRYLTINAIAYDVGFLDPFKGITILQNYLLD